MKRIIVLISICLSCFISKAEKTYYSDPFTSQDTTISLDYQTPNFIFNQDATFTTGNDKEYIIVPMEGYNQHELYKAILVGISKIFADPENAIFCIEDEMIVLNGMTGFCIEYRMGYYAFTYTLRLYFKDGKIRIDTPVVNAFVPTSGEHRSNVAGWIKTQGNYDIVKNSFESGISQEITLLLTKAFSKNEVEW